jgi:hypothetical protein
MPRYNIIYCFDTEQVRIAIIFSQFYQPVEYFKILQDVGFEVFTSVTMKNAALWDVTPCGS